MEKLILKYGEMLIAEHEGKVKKLTIPDVSGRSKLLVAFLQFYRGDNLNKEDMATIQMFLDRKGN